MVRFLTLIRELSFALSMLISSRCTSRSSRRWITHGYFHVLMTPLYVFGTCPHSQLSPPSSLTPTTSALAKSPLLIPISSSPVRTMALSASLTPAQVNVNFLWARRRGALLPASCLSNKYSYIHRGLLPCLLRGPSSVYGTSLLVGDVSAPCQTTRRRLHLSHLTPTRRDY
jgi:hypothetical protein